MDNFRLDGCRAVVTGGGRGIGAGLAKGLADAGADLVLVARSQSQLEKTRDEILRTGRDVGIVAADLSRKEEIDGMFDELVSHHGPVDILVNNAGTTRRAPAHELDLEDWQAVIDVNLTAAFAMCRAFARHRIAAGEGGRIVNVGSLMSSTTRRDNAPYASSKGGILLLTKALAVDWAEYRILVNAIGPGFIKTPLTEPLSKDPDFDRWVKERCPLGRWGSPGDLAGAVIFLASPAANFVTGQILYVDGGWLARF